MGNYIKRYLFCALLAALFMVGEVMMDLIQPEIMARIVDDGVLGLETGGAGDLELIWTLGLRMIVLVLFGGLCGSLNNVFTHISSKNILTVRQGETVAVMGTTGCGKTTLVNLIPRFYDVTAGAVLVDGVDVREYRQQVLREKVAVALQRAELFTVSIGENIAWGRPGAPAEAITAAAETAQADGFIRSAPEGYRTVVAERGMSLSGGQRQRLSIARTVVKPAEILILDDATSALDLKTEADLYDALGKSRPEATKLIVAQRVASARRADRIVVLERGRIADVGTHEELLAGCKVYQDICRSQLGEGDEGIA